MPESSDFEIESIQIIRIEDSKFIFDYDAFQNIVNNNSQYKNLPVGIVIINGALRTGKSFFSNFMIRHLEKLDKGLETNFSDNDEMLKDYFVSRRGADIQTLGVWALNKVFNVNGMALILMDTQGIFDHELNQAMTIALICISCICSSYQIYNLDKRIQEDHLCNMAYFSAYSSLISSSEGSKIGQTLCMLIRDWQNYEDPYNLIECDKEGEKYKKEILSDTQNMDAIKRETREKIFNTYDNVVVRLCPHPGYLVTENKFSGKLSDVRKEFKVHVHHFINKMLSDIKPKRITNRQTLRLKDLPNYMKGYINLYDNIKENLPEPLTILETTEKICQENARTNTIHTYKENMRNGLKGKRLNVDEIKVLHKSCLRKAKRFFNELYIMGSDTDVKIIKVQILTDIDKEYNGFLMMARENSMFNVVLDSFLNLLSNLNIDLKALCMNSLTSDGIKMLVMIIIGAYVLLNMFSPLCPVFILDTLFGAFRLGLCFLAGAFFVIQAKNKNEENNTKTNDHISKERDTPPTYRNNIVEKEKISVY